MKKFLSLIKKDPFLLLVVLVAIAVLAFDIVSALTVYTRHQAYLSGTDFTAMTANPALLMGVIIVNGVLLLLITSYLFFRKR